MSDTIKPWMVNRHFSTLEEYVDTAYRIEATLGEAERKKNGGGKPHHQSQGGFKRPATPQGSGWSKRNKAESTMTKSFKGSENRKSIVTCHNCSKPGHVNRNCPDPQKTCFNYGRSGHVRTFCRQDKNGPDQSRSNSAFQNHQVSNKVAGTTSV